MKKILICAEIAVIIILALCILGPIVLENLHLIPKMNFPWCTEEDLRAFVEDSGIDWERVFREAGYDSIDRENAAGDAVKRVFRNAPQLEQMDCSENGCTFTFVWSYLGDTSKHLEYRREDQMSMNAWLAYENTLNAHQWQIESQSETEMLITGGE